LRSMDFLEFLDGGVKNLPGGLILADLCGKIRAMNKTAEDILGLSVTGESGPPCQTVLSYHPTFCQVVIQATETLKAANRQDLITTRPDGEKIVLGYGSLVLKSANGHPIGVGISFQDITRLIPLMDAHEFLDIALKNLPGGLIFIDLQGKVRGV